MKKLLLTVAVASMFFTACKKEEEVITVSSTSVAPKVIVNGVVKADIDKTNTVFETAPNGTVVIATATEGTQTYRFETTIQNGAFRFELPTSNKGLNFDIDFSDFSTDITTTLGTEKAVIYNATSISTGTVIGGTTLYVENAYTEKY